MASEYTPPIRFLFRFRDLVGATLPEHRRVIEEHGSCWWGWWRRPTEDSRDDVWKALAAEASETNPVVVGLFHSGNGQVHAAEVVQVIPPKPDKQEGQHPGVPAGQELLIPSYYRDSPFSFAWMRLRAIQPQLVDFFERYSFAEAPNLPNYSNMVLSRFKGKVIMDPGELTGMDTTIWEVRVRQNLDPSDRILLTIPSIPDPISYEAVRADGETILHITDLHYAVDDHRKQHRWALEGETGAGPTMVEAILGAIEGEKIGAVLVTGDLTFLGSPKEYEEAWRGLNRLIGTLGLGTESLVVIPGNHDIVWTQDKAYHDNAEVKHAPAIATQNYRQFYRDIFRHEPNEHLSMGRRFLFPSGVAVEVAAVNSSSLETGKHFLAGMGRVQEAALQDVANKLRWNRKADSIALRILALHHHLALTENLEPAADYYRGFGIAVDAVRIQRLAAQYGVQLAIHGHKHRPFIWRSSVYELPESPELRYQLGDLAIVGGGSAGSIETAGSSNCFNLLDVTGTGVRLRIFRTEHGGIFTEKKKCFGALALADDPRRLVLHNWVVK